MAEATRRVSVLRPGATLPALHDRKTRVRLLGWSYADACEGASDGARGGKPDSRLLGRNWELWLAGSYGEFEDVLDGLRAKSRILSVRFQKAWLSDVFVARRGSRLEALRGERRSVWALNFVAARLPASIFVPAVISEAAGYLPGDAKRWERPGWRAA